MKQKIKDLFRKACNKLFLMLAQGIIEKKPDGSIQINSDLIVDGKISCAPFLSVGNASAPENNKLPHKETREAIWGEKSDGYVKLTSGGQQGQISLHSHNVGKLQ